MRSLHRGVRIVLAVAATSLATWPAAAQSVVYLLNAPPPSCVSACEGRVAAIDVDGPRVLWTAAVPASMSSFSTGAYATPDGRVLVWEATSGVTSGARLLVLFDVVTRQATVLPLSRTREVLLPGIVGPAERAEIFTVDDRGPIALSPAGVRALSCPPCDAGSSPLGLDRDGARLLLGTRSGVAVLDTATGVVIGAFSTQGGRVALSLDGTLVYEYLSGSSSVLRAYRAFDGTVAVEVTMPLSIDGMSVDPRTGALWVFSGPALLAVDPITLAVVRSEHAPWWRPVATMAAFTADREAARLYVTSYVPSNGSTGVTAQLDVVDTATMTATISASFPAPFDTHPGVFLPAPRAAAPDGFSAVVSGGGVSLSWTPGGVPAAITRYVLEVGSAPGLNDIFSGLDVGLQTSFAASGVPPGAYYVRVRAGNYSGLSTPSNEVAVVVP